MTDRGYTRGFFLFLSLFALLCLWISASLISGTSPRSLLIRLCAVRPGARTVIEPAFYERQSWIEDIDPDGTTRADLERNGNAARVRFTQDMDTGYAELKTSSVRLSGDAPFDYSRAEWSDERTFVLTVNRPLAEGESVRLGFEFRTTDGRTMPLVVINYE